MATQTIVELDTLGRFDGIQALPKTPPQIISGPTVTLAVGEPSTANVEPQTTSNRLSTGRSAIVITQLVGINFMNSFTNGLITIGLPAIAAALHLHDNLLLWPNSVIFLTSGSCLLIGGSIADVVGPRRVNLVGCLFLGVFILACGLSKTGIDLVMFRAMQGLAGALVVPTSVSIVATSVQTGTPRNVGFACIGLSMPLGFSFGLVLGGVFISSGGWRLGFYIGGAVTLLLFVVGIWALPPDPKWGPQDPVLTRLAKDIDWVGAAMASTSVATFSYVLAMLSADISNIKHASNIALLLLSIVLLPAFIFWMRRQERLRRPALVPNSLWKNASFTSMVVMVLLANAVTNCMELFCSLFFQEVQGMSPLGTSLRLLPNPIVGVCLSLTTGIFINRFPVLWVVLVNTGLCAVSPLLMAIINPGWPYWYDAFFAQLLAPLSADLLFTVGTLVVSDVFPERTQGLAGAVFNMFAQLGTSVGLTTASVISASVTADSRFANKSSPEALMTGYRASFWAQFAWMIVACVVGAMGLRKVGRIGLKRD